MKVFSHTGRGDKVLELKRNLGPLLRQAAFLEGIRELILLANSQQELRLCQKRSRMHSLFFRSGCEYGEVYMGGNVLLPWRFVGVSALGVLPVSGNRAAMPSSKLF